MFHIQPLTDAELINMKMQQEMYQRSVIKSKSSIFIPELLKNFNEKWGFSADTMTIILCNPGNYREKTFKPSKAIIVAQNKQSSVMYNIQDQHCCQFTVKLEESCQQNKKMILNDKYAIFWDSQNIHAISLEGGDCHSDEKEVLKNSHSGREVHDIQVGSNPDYIAIVIANHQPAYDTVMIWDLKINTEKEIIDIDGNYEIKFDNFGNVNIIQDDQVIITKVVQFQTDGGVDTRILRYTVNSFENLWNIESSHGQLRDGFKTQGQVVDGENHDSILSQGDLCLGCCYMTFVIKNFIETKSKTELQGLEFDILPYNYIFNDSTAFIDSKFASDHPKELENVLL